MAEPVKQQIPVHVSFDSKSLREFFKILLIEIVKGKTRIEHFEPESRMHLNDKLRRVLVKGFTSVNFGSSNDVRLNDNAQALDEIVERICKKIAPVIEHELRSNGNKFKKTIL